MKWLPYYQVSNPVWRTKFSLCIDVLRLSKPRIVCRVNPIPRQILTLRELARAVHRPADLVEVDPEVPATKICFRQTLWRCPLHRLQKSEVYCLDSQ